MMAPEYAKHVPWILYIWNPNYHGDVLETIAHRHAAIPIDCDIRHVPEKRHLRPTYLKNAFGPIILLTCLTSCGTLKFKQLNEFKPEYDCFGQDSQPKGFHSRIEEEMHSSGALETRSIKLHSGIGMIEKTVKLYSLNKSRYILLFHFMHVIDLEIEDYTFTIRDESKTIVGGVLDIDTKFSIGQATDEYLFHEISEEEANEMADAGNITLLVGDLPFDIPYECRETFRDALKVK